MSAADNKRIVTAIYEAMAEGDGRPFNAAMAEDFTWILEGTGAWSRTWRGRETVRRELLQPLFASSPRFIAAAPNGSSPRTNMSSSLPGRGHDRGRQAL